MSPLHVGKRNNMFRAAVFSLGLVIAGCESELDIEDKPELHLEVKEKFRISIDQQAEQFLQGTVISEPGAKIVVTSDGANLVYAGLVDEQGMLTLHQALSFDGRTRSYKVRATLGEKKKTVEIGLPEVHAKLFQRTDEIRGGYAECVGTRNFCELTATKSGIEIRGPSKSILRYDGRQIEVRRINSWVSLAVLPVDYSFLDEGQDFAKLLDNRDEWFELPGIEVESLG